MFVTAVTGRLLELQKLSDEALVSQKPISLLTIFCHLKYHPHL